VKLGHLDEYSAARKKAAEFYNEAFYEIPEIYTPLLAEGTNHVFHQYTLRITQGKRDQLKDYLESKGIPAMIYYPVPLRKQKAYDTGGYNDADFPNTNKLIEEVLSLPMHTELHEEQLDFIVSSVKEFFNAN